VPSPDLDHILTAIRAEATRRGGSTRVGVNASETTTPGVRFSRPALVGEPSHVRDYLTFSTERLLDVAYRRLLNRPPDSTGLANFRRSLRTGRRTKVEVLGLIRYSAEGRANRMTLPGLTPAFALALAYRVPLLGWLISFVAAALRLPPHLRDRSLAEQTAQETAAELEG